MFTTDEKIRSAGTFLLTPDEILQSRYRVVRHLGRGGMGAVYEAIDLRLGHTVALKQTLTSDAELWQQFEREARLMAGLNHPVLPRVSDYFTEGNRAFFVMQYVAGSDVSEIILQQQGPLPRHSVIVWADQLLDALIYLHAHERQIIHRDIKPHNLKITPDGKIVLLDFGLAKTQVTDATGAQTSISIFGYTPRYAPLEQIQDLGTSPQSDIYALGATLYHLFTGVKPPDALSRATALVSGRLNPLKPANEINPAIEPELAAILSCSMAQNPDERYASAAEFREALRRLGRVENSAAEALADSTQTDWEAASTEDETVIKSWEGKLPRKRGSRAIAAMFVILLSAFAVFCSYYPWRLPANAPQESPKYTGKAEPLDPPAQTDHRADKVRNQKPAVSRKRSA